MKKLTFVHTAALALSLVATLTFAQSGSSPPLPPDSINAVPASGSSVAISWPASASANAATYRVYRNGNEIANRIDGLSYTDSGVADGSRHQYSVLACDSDEFCGVLTDQVTIVFNAFASGANMVPTGDPIECPAVSASSGNLAASNVTLTAVDDILRMTWTPPDGSVRWNVYRNDLYEFTISNGTPAYDIENHVDGSEYYVTAIFADGTIGPRSPLAVFGEVVADPPPGVDCAAIQAENDILVNENSGLEAQLSTLSSSLISLENQTEALEAELAQALADLMAAEDDLQQCLVDLSEL